MLAVLLGQGQWMVLQSVAWLDMLQDEGRGTTLLERAENTFSGKQPCELCVLVQEGVLSVPADADNPVPRNSLDDLRLVYVLTLLPELATPRAYGRSYSGHWLLPESALPDSPLVPPPIGA